MYLHYSTMDNFKTNLFVEIKLILPHIYQWISEPKCNPNKTLELTNTFDSSQLELLCCLVEYNTHSLTSCASRTPGPMNIRMDILRRLTLDNQIDFRNV